MQVSTKHKNVPRKSSVSDPITTTLTMSATPIKIAPRGQSFKLKGTKIGAVEY